MHRGRGTAGAAPGGGSVWEPRFAPADHLVAPRGAPNAGAATAFDDVWWDATFDWVDPRFRGWVQG